MPDADSPRPLFGKYELGRLLGCGAFAKVYHARDVRSGQSVAIKVIRKTRLTSTSATKREISVMRRLRHPHIVRLYEVLATTTKIFFVMEYVRGGELFARVAKGRLSEDLARRFFRQLIAAVGYCHSRGIFHRDLKLENLLLDDGCNLKVTDFGLSADQPDNLLHTLCGTPAYVAPEILAKKGYDGAGADVWSCGVVLFILAAGYLPFNDSNLMNMYKKIYNGDFRCPRWMSSELKELLSRLLDTNPKTRITVTGILKDPWFNRGSQPEISFSFNHDDGIEVPTKPEDLCCSKSTLNAFHLISFSSGLDLSGLLDEECDPSSDSYRVTSFEEPSRVLTRIDEFASRQGVRSTRGEEFRVQLCWSTEDLAVEVEIHRLTKELIVVEMRRKRGDTGTYRELWVNQIRNILVRDGGKPGQETAVAGV